MEYFRRFALSGILVGALLGPLSGAVQAASMPFPAQEQVIVQEQEVAPDTGAMEIDADLAAAQVDAQELQASIQDLLAIYRRIDGLREVRLTVEDRILEISGTALTQDDRTQAEELAREVPGIIWVDNQIVVESDVRKRLSPMVERLRENGERALRFFPSLLIGLLLIGGSFVLAAWAGRWIFPSRPEEQSRFSRNLMRQGLRAVIGLVGILLALELMDATALVGAVLGAAGVAGIAIGFAFRDIVENYLAGVILSIRQPFFPNDQIEIEGHEGRVVRLTGRETVLMTLAGNHVRIPNATVFKSVMVNFTRNPRRRFLVTVGLHPDEPLGPALQSAREVVQGLPGVLERPACWARIHSFGDSTVVVHVAGWVDQTEADFDKVRSEAFRAIKERFETEGINTPAPEIGVRILSEPTVPAGDGSPESASPKPGRPEISPAPSGPPETRPSEPGSDSSAAPPQTDESGAPGQSEPPLDIAPDTTIEDEIAREKDASDEEDLLKEEDPLKG